MPELSEVETHKLVDVGGIGGSSSCRAGRWM